MMALNFDALSAFLGGLTPPDDNTPRWPGWVLIEEWAQTSKQTERLREQARERGQRIVFVRAPDGGLEGVDG